MRAKEVTDGKITSAQALAESMEGVVPSDKQFKEEFSRASVKKSKLARYYLRAIELYRSEERDPQFLINEDPNAVNLEHVLPVTPSTEWNLDAETASTYYKRIGNMVLLGSRINTSLGQQGFAAKRAEYAKSLIGITKEVADYDSWGPEEIRERQRKLAELAPDVWPLKWR